MFILQNKRGSGTKPCLRPHMEMTGFHQQCLEHTVKELRQAGCIRTYSIQLGSPLDPKRSTHIL